MKYNTPKQIDISDLKNLSYNIEYLKTHELHTSNDFYGNAEILKHYCGLKSKYQIKAAIEHATYFGKDYYWPYDVNHDLPAIIMQGFMRKKILQKVTKKELLSVGTYIQYADSYWDKIKFIQEKQKLGKTLLVFPMHSTHWVNLNYSIKEFISKIKIISKNYSSVVVCMYWKDLLNGQQKLYEKAGFKVVSAGHIYDNNFLRRLRTIIELSDLVCSNDVGSYVGQAIALNKPVYLIQQNYSYNSNDKEQDDGSEYNERLSDFNYLHCFEIFSKPVEIITPEQKDFANYLWGCNLRLTPKEMKKLFKNLDKKYLYSLSFWERIFSVKNDPHKTRKIITILGVKIKIKRKKQKDL